MFSFLILDFYFFIIMIYFYYYISLFNIEIIFIRNNIRNS